MMGYREMTKEENAAVKERNELVVGRIREILTESSVDAKYQDYFKKTAEKILLLEEIYDLSEKGEYCKLSLEELQAYNKKLYEEFYEENYATSYGNPAYAVEKLGDMGQVLSHLYYRISNLFASALTGKKQIITILEELFVQIYNRFEEKDITGEELRTILSEFAHDYVEIQQEVRIREMVNPEWDYFLDIICNADLTDLRYLYCMGVHVTENEIKTAEFINSLSEDEVKAMAFTFTEGFRIGYERLKVDLKTKKSIRLYYALGFERMMRYAVQNIEGYGVKATCSAAVISTTEANRQYNYDHKEDMALYLDKAYVERYLETARQAYEAQKVWANGYAGPAVLETFGEKEFDPKRKDEAIQFDEKQRKLETQFSGQSMELNSEYINPEERSFTIISYPIPEIGPKFKEIFAETVKVNTLDYKTYETIQQKLIDALDQADVVKVKGRGANRTDLTIKIHELSNPEKESAFENCVADVNIPVGEVFTSPVLKGTNGLLHVTQVYLNGLNFKELEIELEDGMIKSYNCANFEKDEDNKKYMMDNVLFNHETVPIGEFAIGTNTVAYKMGKEYDIQAQLPILIAEKTGPHFAMGDTCYSRSEDVKVFNPDGKEVIAKDNEKSLLRDTDKAAAYFNCHTDITIPYNELDTITVVRHDGTTIDLISGGRFVLPGTEELNKPLDSMN
ncbi:MAG: leucyl aminopeptidase [Lachnospiraceae bacterium]|nr:leucyl aminopeptidase [Lachnospiraceae bacterium]